MSQSDCPMCGLRNPGPEHMANAPMLCSERRREPPYRYEATIRVIIAADGLHEAWWKAKALRELVSADKSVVEASTSMLDLKHRPDLDGSLRVTVGADEQPTSGRPLRGLSGGSDSAQGSGQ